MRETKFIKKLLTLFLLPLLVLSCGVSETEMNIDEVFNAVTVKDGTIAGISVGDSWQDAEKKMTKHHGDMFEAKNVDGFFESFDHDYGNEGRRFYFECDLTNGKISIIELSINDIPENSAKIDDLHQKLVDHYTKLYPEGITHAKDEYSDIDVWIIPEAGKSIVIDRPHLIGKAKGATKCWAIFIKMI